MNRASLLLADPSPCLRWLVLRHLLGAAEDHPEVQELASLRETDPLVTGILTRQEADGSWQQRDLAEGSLGSSRVLATAFQLTRLSYLGFDARHPAVAGGAAYLFDQQQQDGSWALSGEDARGEDEKRVASREGYDRIPLQTALPLRGLAACGLAADPRAERAYGWLLEQRLPDGAWPTGVASGVYGGVAGYRRLAHSRWGCRSNTTGALICLALHPRRRAEAEARGALDLLLGRETFEEATLGFEIARLLGAERTRGFLTFYARYDLAQVLSLCHLVGASIDDERVAAIVSFVHAQQGEYGLWEYAARPQVSRWVTFDILRTLAGLGQRVDWLSQEPRTPFQAYPRRKKRF